MIGLFLYSRKDWMSKGNAAKAKVHSLAMQTRRWGSRQASGLCHCVHIVTSHGCCNFHGFFSSLKLERFEGLDRL